MNATNAHELTRVQTDLRGKSNPTHARQTFSFHRHPLSHAKPRFWQSHSDLLDWVSCQRSVHVHDLSPQCSGDLSCVRHHCRSSQWLGCRSQPDATTLDLSLSQSAHTIFDDERALRPEPSPPRCIELWRGCRLTLAEASPGFTDAFLAIALRQW